MQSRLLSVVLIMVFLCQGCQYAPVFVLWNNSSSDAKIEWYNEETVTLKSHSKHKLQNIPTEVAGRKFSAVIIWKGQRYGYVVEYEDLFKFENAYLHSENQLLYENEYRHRHDFQLEEDGKVYLMDPKGYKYGVLTNQPSGFPGL